MPTAPRIGSFAAAMMLLKSYLGSGLLAVPYAFDCGGMEASIIGIFLLAAISNHTLKMMITLKCEVQARMRHVADDKIRDITIHRRAATDSAAIVAKDESEAGAAKEPLLHDARPTTKEQSTSTDRHATENSSTIDVKVIGGHAMGTTGESLSLAALVISNLGIAISYVIFVGNTLADAFQGGHTAGSGDWVTSVGSLTINLFTLLMFPLLLGLCSLKDMSKLGASSALGNVALLVVVIMVLYYSGGEISSQTGSLAAVRVSTFPLFFGISVFSFAMHGVILSLHETMAQPELLPRICDGIAVLVCIVYATFGAVGYAGYRNLVQQSVLSNLPSGNVAVKIIDVLLCLAMLLSVPLFVFPVFELAEKRWLREPSNTRERLDVWGDTEPVTADPTAMTPPVTPHTSQKRANARRVLELRRSALRTSFVFFIVLLAVLLEAVFADVVSFVGAFSMSFLVFILPSVFFLKLLRHKSSRCDLVLAAAVLIFGIVGMATASTVSTYQIVEYFREGNNATQCTTN